MLSAMRNWGLLFVGCVVLAVVAVWAGAAMSGIGDVAEQCSGPVYATDLCDAARLRQAIFGAAVAASGIVAAAVLAGLVAVAGTRRGDAVS